MTALPPVQAAPRPLRVLLLGGTGFIGRHILAALLARGAQVTVASRAPQAHRAGFDSRYPGIAAWVQLRFHDPHSQDEWPQRVAGFDVVINSVGILRQRWRENYEDVHHHVPVRIANACAGAGVRLIHISALALHADAKSRFLSSKWRGELALAQTLADYAIVRPSLLDGPGGFGASWLRGLARWPVHFVPVGAVGELAALRAVDLGEATARLAEQPSLQAWRSVDLGGEHRFSYGEYLQTLRRSELGARVRPALQLAMPNWVARLGSHLCDVLHFSPFSYGHWILLQRHNRPQVNRLAELLGRPALAVAPAPAEPPA